MNRIRLTEGQFHRLIEHILLDEDMFSNDNWKSFRNKVNAYQSKNPTYSCFNDEGIKSLVNYFANHEEVQKVAEVIADSYSNGEIKLPPNFNELGAKEAITYLRQNDYGIQNFVGKWVDDNLNSLSSSEEKALPQTMQYQRASYEDKQVLMYVLAQMVYNNMQKIQGTNESLSHRVTESVIRRLNEWSEDDDWGDDDDDWDDEDEDDDEDDEYNNEPTVESLTDAAKKLSAEKVFNEFAQEISRDDEEKLIDDIVSEGGPRVKYLSDYIEEEIGYEPIALLRQADNYFGTWKTSQWAQEILHQLWWN